VLGKTDHLGGIIQNGIAAHLTEDLGEIGIGLQRALDRAAFLGARDCSDQGGRRAAAMYTLIQTAKLNDVEARAAEKQDRKEERRARRQILG
jgi:hypothetical protein